MSEVIFKNTKKMLVVLSIGLVIFSLYLVLREEPKWDAISTEKKDLIITIPKHNEYGIIRIENEDGEVEHTYAGYFKIHNDGTDGSSVSIGMVIPEGGYIDGSEALPTHIKIYDRSDKSINDYECSPEIKDGILYLYDATRVNAIDVSEQIE